MPKVGCYIKKILFSRSNNGFESGIGLKGVLVLSFTAACLFGDLNAQYLNKIYTRGRNPKVTFTSVQDSLYLYGSVRNVDGSRYDYTLINSSGAILDTLDLDFPVPGHLFDNCRFCLNVRGDRIYNAYTNFVNNDSIFVILSQLSLNPLDTIRTFNYYPQSINYTAAHAWSMKFDSDSTFLVSGLMGRWAQEPDSLLKYDLFLSKFDTAFNLIWETTVEDGVYGRRYGPIGTDIVLDNYGGILVTGNAFYYPILELGFAARFDENGTKLWYKEYPASLGMSGMYCVDNGDGTYQYVQNDWSKFTGGLNNLIVGRMDTSGNILSSQRFGKINRAQFAQDMIRTQDGNYYISGIGYLGNFHSFGFKFTPQGDSLWYRTYHHDDSTDVVYVEGFEEDSGGDLIHFGYHVNNVRPNPGNIAFSWVYRTDEYGCIFQDCHLSNEEIAQLPSIGFFPNPCDGEFRINLNRDLEGPLFVEIYAVNGALLESHIVDDGRQEEVNIRSGLTSGAYYVLLRSRNGEKLGVEKLLIRP